MADEEDITYIVGSKGDTAEPVRGSKLYACSKCGRLVWLAPTGQAMAPGAREEVLADFMHLATGLTRGLLCAAQAAPSAAERFPQ